MKLLFGKLSVGARIIFLYRNWITLFLRRMGFRAQPTIIFLRDGAKFKVRDHKKELSDDYVIHEAYLYGVHNNLLPVLPRAMWGIDIGAFIGTFSVFAAQRSRANILAFEPSPKNFQSLQTNIALNNLQERIIAIPAAVTSRSGQSTLYIPADGGFSALRKDHLQNHALRNFQETEVPTLSVQDIFEKYKIDLCDFIKMDCEGSEYEIIYSLMPETFSRIKMMSIELHDGGDIQELTAFLNRHEFIVKKPLSDFAVISCVNRRFKNEEKT